MTGEISGYMSDVMKKSKETFRGIFTKDDDTSKDKVKNYFQDISTFINDKKTGRKKFEIAKILQNDYVGLISQNSK